MTDPKALAAQLRALADRLDPSGVVIGNTIVTPIPDGQAVELVRPAEADYPCDSPLKVEGTTTRTATLSWRPASSATQRYVIEWGNAHGRLGQAEVPASTTSYVISGLEPAMRYSVDVGPARNNQPPVDVIRVWVTTKPEES